MKRAALSLGVAASLLVFVDSAQAALFPPYNNTVALWLLDEGAGSGIKFNDATTNNNTGVFTGDNNPGNTASFSISFDNVQKEFGKSSLYFVPRFSALGGSVADSPSLHGLTNDFTVEGWWDLTNSVTGNNFPTLISRADAPRARTSWLLSITGSGRLLAQVFDAGGSSMSFTDPNVFPSNRFIHVAMTFSSGILDLYENGSLIGAATNASIHPSGIGRIVLGDDANAGNTTNVDNPGSDQAPWRGHMDEIRISDIVRIPGDGSGTNNFLAWNTSLIPEPNEISFSTLAVAWLVLPLVRRLRK